MASWINQRVNLISNDFTDREKTTQIRRCHVDDCRLAQMATLENGLVYAIVFEVEPPPLTSDQRHLRDFPIEGENEHWLRLSLKAFRFCNDDLTWQLERAIDFSFDHFQGRFHDNRSRLKSNGY